MPSSAKVGLDCCRHQRPGQPAAPPLWRSEWRIVLTTYLRRDLLLLSQAVALMQRAEVLLAGQDEPVASDQVLQLAHSSRCSAYDCEFVAAAQQLGVPLVTEDRAVLVAFPDLIRQEAPSALFLRLYWYASTRRDHHGHEPDPVPARTFATPVH